MTDPVSPSRPDKPALLSLTMIVKNERDSIVRTLDSVLPWVDRYTILDTGSTDGTPDRIRETAERHGVPGRVFESSFVDFAASRNEALELAGDEAVYLISMDANDELRRGPALVSWCADHRDRRGPPFDAFLMTVCWDTVRFSMTRLFRSDAGLRYRGAVHEYLETGTEPTLTVPAAQIDHPRERDEAKSQARWVRDCRILERALASDPADLRNWFYLGQSYVCCGRYRQGYAAYDRRARLGLARDGRDEETWMSLYRRAELADRFLGHPWNEVEAQYLAARDYWPERAEPLVRLGIHYAKVRDYQRAWDWLKAACDLPVPENARMSLDRELYEFGRWDLLGSVALHVGQLEAGASAIRKALGFAGLSPAARRQLEINLRVYESHRRPSPIRPGR